MTDMDALKRLSEKIRSVNGFISGAADSLIKAQDALIEENKAFMELLESEKRGGWIPVTERMPETYNEVLVTIIVKDLRDKEKRIVETAGWFSDGDGCGDWSSVWDEYRVAGMRTKVVAWMPLPEPYKGTEKEGKNNDY